LCWLVAAPHSVMTVLGLLVGNLVQFALLVGLISSWLAAAEKASRSRIAATGAAAFAATLALSLAVLGAFL
jgi:hypothetical protein